MSQAEELESKHLPLSLIYFVDYTFYKYHNYLTVARRENWPHSCATRRLDKGKPSFLRGYRPPASIE